MAADKPKGRVVVDEVRAPVIFAENVEAYGILAGVVRVTLSADLVLPSPDGVRVEPVTVCHLRIPVGTADALIRSLAAAIEMGAPPKPTDKVN